MTRIPYVLDGMLLGILIGVIFFAHQLANLIIMRNEFVTYIENLFRSFS